MCGMHPLLIPHTRNFGLLLHLTPITHCFRLRACLGLGQEEEGQEEEGKEDAWRQRDICGSLLHVPNLGHFVSKGGVCCARLGHRGCSLVSE